MLRIGIALALSLASIAGAAAQTFPNRPIRLIVPFAAGGANDSVARLIQPGLERALGQPVIVENRVGGSGSVGTDLIAKASPDGHILGSVLASHSVNPAVNLKLPFDTEHDLAPVIMIGKNPMLFVVNPKVPARNIAEFVALVKANPEKYNYATPGAATQAHLIISQWSALAGIHIQHVPFRGGNPAILSTVAGDTQFAVMSALVSAPLIATGKLKPLAIGSPQRDPQFPDLPTIMEQGYPDVEAVTWAGFVTTAGTPRPVIERLNAEINRIIREPDVAARLRQQGISPEGGTPEAFGALLHSEIVRWTAIARANHITMQ